MTATPLLAADVDNGAPELLWLAVTGLRTTVVTREPGGAVHWRRSPGPAVPAPLATCDVRPDDDPDAPVLVPGERDGDGLLYRLPTADTVHDLAVAVLDHDAAPDRLLQVAARAGGLAATVGTRLRTRPTVPPPALARWARALDDPAGPVAAITQQWGERRRRVLHRWIAELTGPGAGPVHGALSTGALVHAGPDRPLHVLIGEDVAAAHPEWDLGFLLGDLYETAVLPDPEDDVRPATTTYRRTVTALLRGWTGAAGSSADLDLAARAAVLRLIGHLLDRTGHAGGAQPSPAVVDRLAHLVDTRGRDVLDRTDDLGVRFRPQDPAGHPGIDALLQRSGLGSLRADGLHQLGGRNDNWSGTTSTGRPVLVKRAGTDESLQRTLDFDRAAAGADHRHLRAPDLLAHDPAERLVVFGLLPAPHTLLELSLEGRLGPDLGRAAALALADLHTWSAALPVEPVGPVMPPIGWLVDGLPWSAVEQFSMGQLAAWRLLQGDADVVTALVRLRTDEAAAAPRPVHADLRLDQWIHSGGELYLCDWEEFRLGDPARDLGTVVGELIHHTVARMFLDDETARTWDHQAVLDRGRAALRDIAPALRAFWTTYHHATGDDRELRLRALRFAGWHLFDRLVAAGEGQNVLSPVARAGAGLGRSLLLDPDRFLRSLEDDR